MLLLTSTARERAWRLLKITGPLIGWLDGDSPIPGVSPWLAPLSWCTVYIVEVQRTSEQLFLRLRNSNSQIGIDHRRRSRRWGVWKAACSTRTTREPKLLWRQRCVTSSTFGANLQWPFSSFAFGVLWIFFWKAMSIKPSRNSGWVHRNWGPFEEICWAQTTKLGHGGGFRKREHNAFCMLTCMVPGQPLVRDDLSSRDEANTLAKMQVTVGFWLRMYAYSSLHTNAKARENSKNN